MKLYHGTNQSSALNICVNGINLLCSAKYLDFGVGFYTTKDEYKAIKRARKKTDDFNKRCKTNEVPYVVELTIDDKKLKNYSIMEFDGHDIEWCKFVLNNRLKDNFLHKNKFLHHNKDNKYDIVFGEIADGKITDIAYRIRNNELDICDVDYSQILTDNEEPYGNQVSFHTTKSLSCITSLNCDIIRKSNKMKGGEWL